MKLILEVIELEQLIQQCEFDTEKCSLMHDTASHCSRHALGDGF